MLAKKRGIYRGGDVVIRTPLLLPSFSSKGFPEVQNILATTSEAIDGEILVSAYDVHHKHIAPPFDFAEAIFLDSGGYEASQDVELSEIKHQLYKPAAWTIEHYQEVIQSWQSSRPTVFVSYDHPDERVSVPDQISRAEKTLPSGDHRYSEILFKPNNKKSDETDVSAIVANIHRLAQFDVLGVTEKEIGSSLQARMISIARIRKALDDAGLDKKPIHIFGSLDTISTPLYFIAGADIFDGLTWLRFAYHEGMTIYRQNYAALALGSQIKSDLVDARCFFANYQYMKEMQLDMRRYLTTKSFDSFRHHAKLFERAYHDVVGEMEA